MKKYNYYCFQCGLIILINSLLICLFNILIDPYGGFHVTSIKGINKLKPEKNNHVRYFKAIEITRSKKIAMIFLGSSRTEMGLDPNHPALANYQPSYNLAITGANMYEVMRYFQQAIANQPNLKEIVLGIDFFMFNEFNKNKLDFKENRLETNRITIEDTFEHVFSLNALMSSIKTININRKSSNTIDYFYPNGMRNTTYYLEQVYQNKDRNLIFKKTIEDFLNRPDLYKNYQLSEARINNLKTIISTCKKRGIKLKILISPSHVYEWEAIRAAGHWSVFEQWKLEVVKASPIWDFSGYNDITNESVSNKMKYYIDSSHYSKEAGDLVLDRIFNYQEQQIPKDFGILITPTNIESHLKKIRVERELWAKNNPEMVQFIENLKPR